MIIILVAKDIFSIIKINTNESNDRKRVKDYITGLLI